MSVVKVTLERVGPCAYDATDALGNTIRMSGSAELDQQIRERLPDPSLFPETLPVLENSGPGFRPMALLLISLAGCSALDLGLILARQRQDVRGLTIEAEGTRVEATPRALHEHCPDVYCLRACRSRRTGAGGGAGGSALLLGGGLAQT